MIPAIFAGYFVRSETDRQFLVLDLGSYRA